MDYFMEEPILNAHNKGECSRSELLLHAGMEVIRKDREFREFLKKNPEIPG